MSEAVSSGIDIAAALDAGQQASDSMPGKPRPRSALDEIADAPGTFDLFQAMRRIEAEHPHLPRLGDSRRPVDDPMQRKPDLTLARSVLGWEPEITLDEGLARTTEWFAKVVGRG